MENKRKTSTYQPAELFKSKRNKKGNHYFRCTGRGTTPFSSMNHQGKTVTRKENDNSLETKFKVMEGCNLNK